MKIISKRHSILLLLVALTISSCSRKKDNFVSRTWHSVGTEYNILFNGNLALESGRENLNEGYTDNYWELLPIERMQISEEVVLPGQSKNADFERAEEKATKAIQKHSMNIQGKEKNPQMDEAYLLLGKARYFDQRFIPALESFNYILFKYPASDKINQAKIWREKTNLRLENTDLAIDNLKRLLRRADIEKQDLADATSTLAQAYINNKALDSAIVQLEIAASETRSNDEKGRYHFIQGQLYNALGVRDSANLAFDKVIELNRKTPRIYWVSAHLEKAKNFDFENQDKLAFLELLTELEENRENRPYLDKIYYQIGEFHNGNSSDSLAVTYYNKSLRTNSQDKFLKAKNYQILGDMNFDNAEYRVAGAYYDSTMRNLNERTKLWRSINKKKENLADVIRYEDIAQRNDSILALVRMTEDERLALFTSYTDELRQKAEEAKAAEEAAELRQQNAAKAAASNTSRTNARGGIANARGETAFYFYNQTTVAFGRNEFIQSWGDRELTDNWRWADKSQYTSDDTTIDEDLVNATEDELYDPQFYIARIPTEQTAIDSLQKDRNFAYYQLGLIYKDKFKEFLLAKDKLRGLLDSDPEERLILPAKYNLYKIYQELNLNDEAEITKNDIITNHPDSRYATILLNPNTILEEDENSPENIYKRIYGQYEAQKFEEVIAETDKYITLLDGEAIVPKFEYLKAVAKGRLNGFTSYKEAINFIALNYPNSEEGKSAEAMMQTTIPLLEKNEFVDDDSARRFKVLYRFENATQEDLEAFQKELDDAVEKIRFFELSTSIDRYDTSTTFVVVHGLTSIQGASGFAEILNEREDTNITRDHIAISSPNYQIVQIHKNLEAYLKAE